MNEKVRAHLHISGLVQGVFLRDSAREKAEELEITGWVKNLPDGRVEIMAEGEKEKVDKFIEWAGEGPSTARIDDLEVEWEEYVGKFNSFEVRY